MSRYATFKSRPLEFRREQQQRLALKYPERFAILLRFDFDSDPTLSDVVAHAKFKYLVPSDMLFSELACLIRKRIPRLSPETALFLNIRGTIPPMTRMLSQELVNTNRDDDGFWTITVLSENTFGSLEV